jgi:hypothetical protein
MTIERQPPGLELGRRSAWQMRLALMKLFELRLTLVPNTEPLPLKFGLGSLTPWVFMQRA